MNIYTSLFISLCFMQCTSKHTHTTTHIELYAKVPYAVGNIAYTPDGELVYSNHPFYDPVVRVMKYDAKTKTPVPFPNEDWNTVKQDNENYLSSVLGIRNDSKGIIWMLDMGFRNHITPKFVGWNTKTNALERIYPIPSPSFIPSSQLNDFVIDEVHQVFIIADEEIGPGGDGTHSALVVVDMKTGKSRRLLEGHYSTIPEYQPLRFGSDTLCIPNTTKPLLVGVDGITLDKNNEWLYYTPLSSTKVYRIKIEYLIDESISEKSLGEKVEVYANKQNNGGLSIDEDNNLYLTLVETNSIGIIPSQTKSMYTYSQNEHLIWPDGVSYNAQDGYMYVSASQVNLAGVFHQGKDKTSPPFVIYRFKPLHKGILGR